MSVDDPVTIREGYWVYGFDLAKLVAAHVRWFCAAQVETQVGPDTRDRNLDRVEQAAADIARRASDDIQLVALWKLLQQLPWGRSVSTTGYEPPPGSAQAVVLARFAQTFRAGPGLCPPERLLGELVLAAAEDALSEQLGTLRALREEKAKLEAQVARFTDVEEDNARLRDENARFRGEVDRARGAEQAERERADRIERRYELAWGNALETEGDVEPEEADEGEIEPVTSRKFTEDQVDLILGILASENGNSTLAAPRLAEMGFEIDESSLRRWRRDYPNRYRAIQISQARAAMEATA